MDYQSAIPTPPGIIERRIRVRLRRQELLTSREPPLDLSAVLDEAVILRKVGGSDLMYRQLLHLVEVAELTNVDLRILPLASGGVRLTDSFAVLSFGLPAAGDTASVLEDVVWVESVKSQIFVGGEKETYNFSLVFNG